MYFLVITSIINILKKVGGFKGKNDDELSFSASQSHERKLRNHETPLVTDTKKGLN